MSWHARHQTSDCMCGNMKAPSFAFCFKIKSSPCYECSAGDQTLLLLLHRPDSAARAYPAVKRGFLYGNVVFLEE
jgi:hypothetical protein